jgi:hypothetical protein
MATLKSQIEKIDFTGMEREANQKCNIIERKMAPNGCGAEFILVEFSSSNNHPYDAKGLNVVVIEEDYAYIENSYKKNIFNI